MSKTKKISTNGRLFVKKVWFLIKFEVPYLENTILISITTPVLKHVLRDVLGNFRVGVRGRRDGVTLLLLVT